MNRYAIRWIGAIVLGLIALGVRYYSGTDRRADASKQVLKASQEMIKDVPGYAESAGYMDWLVKEGHKNVFNDSYSIDVGSRYRAGDDSMELGKYEHDLFQWMIDRANADGSKHIAEALKKFEDGPAPEANPADKKGSKQPTDNPFSKK